MRRGVLVVALLAVAASAAPAVYERPQNSDCIASSADGLSLFPEQFLLLGDSQKNTSSYIEVTTATGFSVQYFDNYKVVHNSIANETYVLYQCGVSAPPADEFPAGTKFFQIPLVSVSAPETIPYAAMVQLGLTDRVYDAPAFVTAPCGQALLQQCNRTAPDAMSLGDTPLLESGVGPAVDGMLTTLPNNFTKAFAFSSSMDPGVLKRAEWIKFLGLFFNKEREASELYASMEKQYNDLKASTAAAPPSGKKPVVAFILHFSYGGVENYQISWAPYKAELAADAGAQMLNMADVAAVKGVQPDTYSNTTLVFGWGSEGAFADKQAALDAFLAALSKVDVVVDETYAMDPTKYDVAAFLKEYGLTKEVAEQQPWFANEKVFREDGLLSEGLGMDWFEGALLRPADVLRDMVRAARPDLAQNATEFTWIRNLFSESPVVLGAEACSAPASCTDTPVPICPFVSPCPTDNPAFKTQPALLKGLEEGACIYEKCQAVAAGEGQASQGSAQGSGSGPSNAAQLAAPAVVLLAGIVVLVEVLLNC